MKYTVKSGEGELVFQSFGQLEAAFFSGLVDPEDWIQEEGSAQWKKTSSFAALRRQPPPTSKEIQTRAFWMFVCVGLGSVALWGLQQRNYAVLLTCAVLVAVIFIRVSVRANRVKRPR